MNIYRLRTIAKLMAVAICMCFCLIVGGIQTYAYDNVVVVIDPGHGGVVTDDNSNGGCIYNNLMEKEVNLNTAKALYDELSTYQNVTVYMTRTTDEEMSIPERVQYAKSVGADVLVSVHYNASNDHNFYGSEIFTSMYGDFYATGNGLGQCIQKRWTGYGTASKGIKTREGNNGDYYGLIRQGKEAGIPTIILEHGYLDNDADYLRIGNPEAWNELGRLDAEGIAEYYGLRKDLVLADIIPTVKVNSPGSPKKPDTTPPENVKLVVTDYDRDSGEVKFSISASETDENLMYYGFYTGNVTDSTVFEELELWDNSTGIQTGMFMAPRGFEGKLTARVYNTYELYADSEAVDLGSYTNNGRTVSDDADGEDGESENGESGKDADGLIFSEGGGPKIINEIDMNGLGAGDSENKHVDITTKMVDNAMKPKMESNKAILGLVVTISVVLLTALTAIVIAVSSSMGRKNKNKRHKYDWEE